MNPYNLFVLKYILDKPFFFWLKVTHNQNEENYFSERNNKKSYFSDFIKIQSKIASSIYFSRDLGFCTSHFYAHARFFPPTHIAISRKLINVPPYYTFFKWVG